MKITSRTEYALLALILLGRNYGKDLLSASSIAKQQGIPLRFLQQILRDLQKFRLVNSVKGAKGGYLLTRAPAELTLAEVVRIFEGAIAPSTSASKFFYAPTPIEKEKKMLNILLDIRDQVVKILEEKTLLDIL